MLKKMLLSDFDEVYKIMEEAFPVDEIRTYEDQKAILLENPKFNPFVLKNEKTGEIEGFISVYNFSNFFYIEHFAIKYKYRNNGLGSKILQEILNLYKGRVCLEAEVPNTEIAIRRIEFYKRNGFLKNDYDYIQPPMSKGRKPVPLVILTTGGNISKEEFQEIKNTLYKEVYKTDGNF